MIIFLYGEDNFRSRQKLNEIIDRYKSTQADSVNYTSLDFEIEDLKEFRRKLDSQSLFPEKKFIVCKNAFAKKDVRDYFFNFLKENKIDGNDEVVLFYEAAMPDEKNDFFKLLKRISNYQEFKSLNRASLNQWLKKEIEIRGGTADFAVIAKIADIFGDNLWEISNEIDKLIAFNKKINLENINLFSEKILSFNIFDFLDSLGTKDKKNSLLALEKYFEAGENENYILAMISGQFRNLAKIASLKGFSEGSGRESLPPEWPKLAGDLSQAEISKRAGIHPFVVKKSIEKLKNFNSGKIRKIYSQLAETDFKIKTGRQDAKIALNLLVLESVK